MIEMGYQVIHLNGSLDRRSTERPVDVELHLLEMGTLRLTCVS